MTRVRPSGGAPGVASAATCVPGMSGAPRLASALLSADAPRSAGALLSADALHRAGDAIASDAGVSCRVAR